MEETWVQSLVGVDPCALEQPSPHTTIIEPVLQSPGTATTEDHAPRAYVPQQEKPLQWSLRTTTRAVPTRHS